jgi:antitoxin HicB
MRVAVYSYYSLIEKDEDGAFIVTFLDLENVFTDGSTLKEAVEMAEDVLGLMLGYA